MVFAVGLIVASCRSDFSAPPPDSGTEQSTGSAFEGPLLVNDEFEITKMATADDVLIIEVDATPSVDAGELARTLVEPVQDRYPEVLVYVRWPADEARPNRQDSMDGGAGVPGNGAGAVSVTSSPPVVTIGLNGEAEQPCVGRL